MTDAPRVLLLDIETTPSLVYTWGLFDQNIGLNQVVEPTRMLSFAGKWIGERKVHFFGGPETSHERMVNDAWAMMDAADVVVHYNGRSFDEKHLNREFLEHRLDPPSPYQTVDLYSTVKGRFRFLSNKLEHVSRELGLEGKVAHEGFGLWTKCMSGDPAAWRRMEKYNRRDVTLLEDLYRELLPWIKGHPNLQHFGSGDGCPRCGHGESIKRGFHRTAASVFQTRQCKGCGGYFRDRKAMRRATEGRSV